MAASPTPRKNDAPQEQAPTPAPAWVQAVTKNLKLIGCIMGGVVLVAAGFTGYSYYKSRTLRNAQQKVDQILGQQKGTERIQALQAFLPQAPQRMTTALHLQLAKLCMQEEVYDQAGPHWEYIRQNTEDTDMKIVAVLGQSTALAAQGETTKALDMLDTSLDSAPERYQRNLNMKIASIAEESGQWERALSAYQAIQNMADLASRRDEFLTHKITMLQNKVDSANS